MAAHTLRPYVSYGRERMKRKEVLSVTLLLNKLENQQGDAKNLEVRREY
jgi:hypothetical protein